MRVSIVVALDQRGVIGRDGDLPWRLPDDQRFFKQLTMGHALVMGRKTFDSIGRPLPGRRTFVVTRNPEFRAEGTTRVGSVDDALSAAERSGESECFVVGGREIYALALDRCDALYLTRVEAEVEGDVHFPDFDASRWKLVSDEPHAADDRHAYAFRIQQLERVAAR